MALVKMDRHLVQFGMPSLVEVRDAEGNLLLARGAIIENDEQLAALMAHGAMVEGEDAKAAMAAINGARPEPVETRPTSVFGLWDQLRWRLERIVKGIADEPKQFEARIDELAQHLALLTEKDADVGIFLAVRQDTRKLSIYGLSHAIYTGMMCFLMAQRMGWPRERCLTLVKAALTMNMSVFELQGRLAAQGVPMLAEQRAVLHEHPLESARMLREVGITDEEWLTAVEQHHEWNDGKGYPRGLTEMSEMAKALKYADVFMAKISPKAIRKPLHAQEAARDLYKTDGGGAMAMAIIKEFGIYPPGELVKLKTGELAVVIRRTASANTPIAASITDRTGVPVLNIVRRDTSRAEHAITGFVADKSVLDRVPPERLYGLPA
ncbi:HD-GYP domain-containing protein [Piscinibacter sp. HJYY11]|uniref:HD-GYP domain-containing protein n=1 Tax=Piscinibacter sp. HJYY11 TaxID=2801333 RepID=UPI00191D5DAE|nr:HD domain-containing phosphohydrolase [Piscinibacter sp. HJYY11]MBL0730187.1 phosphohydrolase [Piscinibacter sp. HJYY11]